MHRSLDLSGSGWEIRGFLGVDAALRVASRPTFDDGPGWLPARVPGSVLDDLWRAGEVPDPYVERNSLACEWVAERAWLYRRRLAIDALRPGERAWLRFDGIDHAGDVFLDGVHVGRHEGMFVPFEVDLTDPLGAGGERSLAVVVGPAPESEPQVGRTSRVVVHKSRMTYGWDFCPRLVHQGLWQPVRLEISGLVRIRDVWARPRLSPDLRHARAQVTASVDLARPAVVRVEASLEGRSSRGTASDHDLPAGRWEVVLELSVPEPALWWPIGLGEPVMHRLTLRACVAGELLDERSVPVGFRQVELAPNAGAPDGARPYTFVVNGRPIYIKGWNWVPVDALYGVPRTERLDHLLRFAANAHVNLLRVWGGGLIETEAFYDACDARGLMVWQEFSQSSSGVESTPSEDHGFVALMRHEAEAIVPLRRNHPSLVAWCGGNELEGADGPLDDSAPVLAALRDVVGRLDPDRAWLPTSPSGPRFHNRLDVIEADPSGLHDVHGPWEHQGLRGQYELYDRGTSLFNSEFGVEGMTNRRTHEALIAPPNRWPATRANPVYRHLGDWWINEPFVQEAFGGRLTDLDALRRASQFLQAEGLRYAVEANRRRWPRQSGSIPWQFNESYPNAWCTSAVDHRGDPKPAYHAVARAYAPLVVCASFEGAAWGGRAPFEAEIWAWSDGDAIADACVEARLVDLDGGVVARGSWTLDLAPGAAAAVGRIASDVVPPLFLLDLSLTSSSTDPGGPLALAANRYPFSGSGDFAGLLDLPPARLETSMEDGPDEWLVTLGHAGGPSAMGVIVEDDRPIAAPGWAELDDNGFLLLPGERRTLRLRWANAGASEPRRIRVSGWNVEPIVLEGGA